jgi:hypothetical protein
VTSGFSGSNIEKASAQLGEEGWPCWYNVYLNIIDTMLYANNCEKDNGTVFKII